MGRGTGGGMWVEMFFVFLLGGEGGRGGLFFPNFVFFSTFFSFLFFLFFFSFSFDFRFSCPSFFLFFRPLTTGSATYTPGAPRGYPHVLAVSGEEEIDR